MVRFIWSLVMLFSVCGRASDAQQADEVRQAKIVGVEVQKWMSIIVSVRSQQMRFVIAACGSNESGLESLCQATVYLEGRKGAAWRRVERENSGRIIGGSSSEKWHPILITPERDQSLAFGFPYGLYVIHSGEQLRLVIKGWPDEAAMRRGQGSEEIVSNEFTVP